MQSLKTTYWNWTAALVFIFSLLSAEAQPISLVQKPLWPGFRRGGADGVIVSNNYAFVAASQGGLMVLDVSNASSPRLVSQTLVGWAVDVKLSSHFAYVTTLGSVAIVDIADPVHPNVLSFMNYGRSIGVDVLGNTAYVADEDNGLRIYNVSNPSSPTQLGTTTNGFGVRDVKVVGNYAYVAATDDSVKIVNVSNPANPVVVGSASNLVVIPERVCVRSNYVFLSDIGYGLHILM